MAIRQRQQGTVVGTPEIGTLDGPKQAPPTTQYGGTEQVPNTQSTLTMPRGWPANPARNIASANGAREHIPTTDYLLQIGWAPNRIVRQLFDRVFGKTGEEVGSFPMLGDLLYIPHLNVPRTAQGTGPYRRVYDDAAPIPAVYAGNPRIG